MGTAVPDFFVTGGNLRPDALSVYTVARLDAAVDFERPEVRPTYAPLLAALVQVKEATHAGAPADTIGITHAVLNRRHWAGVSLLGAEHLGTVAHVQIMVEYIEILLVSVYAAHLWHMIEPHIHWAWLHEKWWIMPRGSWGLLVIALVAGGITALCLKPWRLRQQHHGTGG